MLTSWMMLSPVSQDDADVLMAIQWAASLSQWNLITQERLWLYCR